jgi:hypothetical protein
VELGEGKSVRLILAALLVSACIAPLVFASSGSHSLAVTTSTHSATGSHRDAAPWVHRDSHGKIARDPRQLSAFKKQNPCPATGKTYGSCPGYTVDHVIPLKRGGPDSPSNMQWQTNEAAKAKDKWE